MLYYQNVACGYDSSDDEVARSIPLLQSTSCSSIAITSQGNEKKKVLFKMQDAHYQQRSKL